MTLYQQTRESLRELGLRPSKARGQSFLIDWNMAAYIARQGTADGPKNILEVGPGLGSLTQELLQHAHHLLAIEKERALADALRERFKGDPRLQVECADFLALDLEPYLGDVSGRFPLPLDGGGLGRGWDNPLPPPSPSPTEGGGKSSPGGALSLCSGTEPHLGEGQTWRVVANLPYSVTTPILFRLFEQRRYFDCFFLTLQKEVAQRLAAPSGTKEYGALSIAVQMWSEVKILRTIPPECFYPRPKVTSALVRFTLRSEPAVPVADLRLFETLSRGIFQHRRKQLVNSLAFVFPSFDRSAIRDLLSGVGIPPATRPEELSLSDLAQITSALGSRLSALETDTPKPKAQSLKPKAWG